MDLRRHIRRCMVDIPPWRRQNSTSLRLKGQSREMLIPADSATIPRYNGLYVARLRRRAASRGNQSVGAHPERSPEEDFQPRARQLTPSADWRHSGEHRRSPAQASSAHADRDRRRLRRHRHQPAVRDARVLLRLALRAADARERARRAVADHLLAAAGHLGQVHRDRDARRQPGRRRHPRADGAAAAARRQSARAGRCSSCWASSAPRCSTATA